MTSTNQDFRSLIVLTTSVFLHVFLVASALWFFGSASIVAYSVA